MDSSGYQQPVVDTRLFDILAYLGLCPFVIGLLLQITEVSLLGIDARLFFTAYSAVILSFYVVSGGVGHLIAPVIRTEWRWCFSVI